MRTIRAGWPVIRTAPCRTSRPVSRVRASRAVAVERTRTIRPGRIRPGTVERTSGTVAIQRTWTTITLRPTVRTSRAVGSNERGPSDRGASDRGPSNERGWTIRPERPRTVERTSGRSRSKERGPRSPSGRLYGRAARSPSNGRAGRSRSNERGPSARGPSDRGPSDRGPSNEQERAAGRRTGVADGQCCPSSDVNCDHRERGPRSSQLEERPFDGRDERASSATGGRSRCTISEGNDIRFGRIPSVRYSF